MKCEVFMCVDSNDLQEALELFLDDHPNIEIVHMTQSETSNGSLFWLSRQDITLTLIYKEK